MSDATRQPMTIRLDPEDKAEVERLAAAVCLDPSVALRQIVSHVIAETRVGADLFDVLRAIKATKKPGRTP
jgi:predicted transcriptional regulator